MTQEAFEKAKAILARIAELEKKGEKIPDVKSVRISVSYNGVSFVDASTTLSQEVIDEYKNTIADDCNKTNSGIKETISNLYSEFFSL
jgi:hypothetical protein